jgi:hypothetical protein
MGTAGDNDERKKVLDRVPSPRVIIVSIESIEEEE